MERDEETGGRDARTECPGYDQSKIGLGQLTQQHELGVQLAGGTDHEPHQCVRNRRVAELFNRDEDGHIDGYVMLDGSQASQEVEISQSREWSPPGCSRALRVHLFRRRRRFSMIRVSRPTPAPVFTGTRFFTA